MKPIITFFFICLSAMAFCQNTKTAFPYSWEGKWAGTLEVFSDTGKVQQLPMQLHILPLDTLPKAWTWRIVYGTEKDGARPYELITVDAEKGQYLIDEKNSILMEGYYLGGKFYQWFEVQGSRLLTATEMRDGALEWEIVVSKEEPVSTTGGQVVEGEEVPPVLAFPVKVVQRARLEKRL